MERIQKVIANSGYCSRRKAEELLIKGKIKVNGEVVRELGILVDSKDIISVEGNTITKDDKIYYLINKPRGVVTTTSDDKNRETVIDLINDTRRIYPVGRLDYDTTGALLLTNDGELTNLLIHPKSKIDKVYIAKVEGILSGIEIKKLETGIIIDGVKTSRAKVKITKVDKAKHTTMVQLTIHEGKNHQVKKMFESINHKVLKLKRDKFSFLDLHGLKSGEYRELSLKEVKKLYFEATKQD